MSKKTLLQQNNTSAALLVKRILVIMSDEITAIEKGEESTLSDNVQKLLPQYLRIILACQVVERKETKEDEDAISYLTDEQLEALYQKEKR